MAEDDSEGGRLTLGAMFRFFLPVATQSASQGITYPLVAMVASRGLGGTAELAGLAQANSVMTVLGTIGAGMSTTGMVFIRSKLSYRRFRSLNNIQAAVALAIQAAISVPLASNFVFGRVIGMPAPMLPYAQLALLLSIAMQWLFFMRNPYMVMLYQAKATTTAMMATFARIALTAALSPVFCAAGLVGVTWATICMVVPIAVETGAVALMARPYFAQLPEREEAPATRRYMSAFNIPLSLGQLFMSFAGAIIGAFVSRAPDPEVMLPVYFLCIGLVNPFWYAALRTQTVVLAFKPSGVADRRTLRFSLLAGLVATAPLLLFLHPRVASGYFVTLQNMAVESLPLAIQTMLLCLTLPLLVASRGWAEGVAAVSRKSAAIMAGQAAYIVGLGASCYLALVSGLPGHLIGAVGVVAANLMALFTTRVATQQNGTSPPAPPIAPSLENE